jgi:hypothetical protein
MNRTQIRAFLQAGVTNIDPNMPFGSGLITEWNSNRSNEYPAVWWESIVADSSELTEQVLPLDEWPIRLHIAKLDKADSLSTQYEALVDECHYIAQQLVHQYSQIMSNTYYSSVSITGISREPFIKKNEDRITGVILSFTLTDPDKTNLC